MKIQTVASLKKELHKAGIKTYLNKKDGKSYVMKADVRKILASQKIKLDGFTLVDGGEDGWYVEYTGDYTDAAQDVSDNSENFFNLRSGAEDGDDKAKLQKYANEYLKEIKDVHIDHYDED